MRELRRQARAARATGIARRGVGALVVVVLALALPVAPGSAAGGGDAASAARASDQVRSATRKRSDQVQIRSAARKRAALRAHERIRLRRALLRNPRRALRGDFLGQAANAGLRMPVTVRLRSVCDPDQNPAGGSVSPGGYLGTTENCASQGTALNEREGTEIGVTWAPIGFPLDGGFPAASGEQTLRLAGSFPMVIDFGAGPGYGGVGNIQARSGPGGSITAAGPLVIAERGAGCTGSSPPFVEAATSTIGGAPIAASAAVQTWVDMNPFSGSSAGYLDLKLSVRSRVLRGDADCLLPGPSADYDVPVTAAPTDPWNTPVRIRWEGGFRIAPAITRDGAIRLGKISVNDAIRPQLATSGKLWGCAAESAITGAGLPLSASCTSASPFAPAEAVGPAPFPATLIVKTLSADILLGDRP